MHLPYSPHLLFHWPHMWDLSVLLIPNTPPQTFYSQQLNYLIQFWICFILHIFNSHIIHSPDSRIIRLIELPQSVQYLDSPIIQLLKLPHHPIWFLFHLTSILSFPRQTASRLTAHHFVFYFCWGQWEVQFVLSGPRKYSGSKGLKNWKT